MRQLHHIKNHKQETQSFKSRTLKAIIVIAILIIILIIRLLNLQIINYRRYINLAQSNQQKTIPIEPNRGLIYDRNGVLLAENLPYFSLSIVPENTSNLKETINKLQTIIKSTPQEILQFKKTLQQRRHLEHIPLKFKLTQEEVATFYLNRYRFPGVIVEATLIRHYPLGKIMANALGYVGRINSQDLKTININNYSASNFIGKLGIEKYYEKSLHGTTGQKTAQVSANGNITRITKITPPTNGNTLYLTIDSKLQQIAYDAFGDEHGSAVVIDPNNGEILALVSHPSYDPNLFVTGIDTQTFKTLQNSKTKPMYNRATLGLFPFASTIKPFLALQGLDTEIFSTTFQISDPGWFKLPNTTHVYRDWRIDGHGIVNVTKAIMVSCDTFFYATSVKLGIEKINNILQRFGFGTKTNIDIGEEANGIIASPQWKLTHRGKPWYLGDTIISSIGQGFMATTPVQLANGVAALAMRGKRFQPHLLLATQSPTGLTQINNPTPLIPVHLKNPKHWDTVIQAMQEVIINPMGTGYRRFGQNLQYTVAGKTGGAQLFHRKTKLTPEYERRITKHLRDHNLFIAFAPIKNPKVAVAVVTENSTIAPQITRKILDYYLTGQEPTVENNTNVIR